MRKNQPDIYFFEAFKEEEQKLREFIPKNIKAGYTWKTIQEKKCDSPPAKLISVRTQSLLPGEWSPDLDGILSRSTGYDHLTKYRKRINSELELGYLPLYCNRSVAEQALVLWMSILRKLPQQIKNLKTFRRDGLTGFETVNKTLLVVGVGNIGSEVVKIGAGMGMEVLGVDLIEKHSFVNYTTIDKGLEKADIIVCAMNLTKDNINYFNYKRLCATKKGVVFINIARGELSHSVDLLQLMKERLLGGIGIDVYNNESDLALSLRSERFSDNEEVQATVELSKYPNVIMTPHNAFNTLEAVIRKSEQSARQVEHFMKNGCFLWPIPE